MSDEDKQEWHDELAAARRAPGRSGRATNPFETETPARDVPCMGCKRSTRLSGFAWEFAKQASLMLLSKGEQPLRNDEMTRCDACAAAWNKERLGLFETFCEKANKAQHDANTEGRVDEPLVKLMRFYGYRDWADGIEAGAAKFNESQSTRGRAHKERK